MGLPKAIEKLGRALLRLIGGPHTRHWLLNPYAVPTTGQPESAPRPLSGTGRWKERGKDSEVRKKGGSPRKRQQRETHGNTNKEMERERYKRQRDADRQTGKILKIKTGSER